MRRMIVRGARLAPGLVASFAAGPRRTETRLGLSENWRQFTLLVVINAFVGAMVGLERAVLPVVAATEFAVASTTAALSFIAVFGLTKALTNLAAGQLVDRRGRRFTLIAGWLLAIPVPLIILWAPSWWWIVAANALLGVNQGLAWSATVIMKIDLVGPRRRGLAMGLNEFAGYLAVAIAALASGIVASTYGLRAGPAYAGVGIALAGLALSAIFVRETSQHALLEERSDPDNLGEQPSASQLLRRSLWSDRGLFSVSQAGLVNNINDGLAWGVFPLLFAAAALSIREMSALVAIYPAVWGVCQLWTGPLSDRLGRKWLIVTGMVVQGIALVALAGTQGVRAWSAALIALGVGTALVYPTLLAAVGDIARPSWRGTAIGVYRLWRDLGYVAGALLAGILADAFGVSAAIRRDRRAHDRLRAARGGSIPKDSQLGRSMIMQWLSQPWPWYVAGPLIGLFVPLLLLIGNKPLGATPSLRAICAAVAPGSVDFFKYDWKRAGAWNVVLVTGIAAGGFIAARLLPHDTSGLAPAGIFSWSALLTFRGVMCVIVGGFLAGFGATYAGGCTSGHGITGLASLQLASLIAVIAIFAGGIVTTWLLLPLIL